MPTPKSRPLAPAQPLVNGQAKSRSNSPVTQQSSGGFITKRASTACQSCQQIKRKCDQGLPCSNCQKSRTQCIYNEADDGRRKAARKRTVESLEQKRDALDSILDMLRTSDDLHVQQLIRLVRSQASLEEVIQYATIHSGPSSNVRLSAGSDDQGDQQRRRTVFSVDDLCDTPIFKVPSTPWTTATTDDTFVAHLISIYFTWFHIAYPIVDRDLFISSMSSGTLASQHCSPFLVNSMLVIACHFSDHPQACKTLSDPSTRGVHFMDEATRLWSLQSGQVSLLNAQALLILAVSCTLMGKDSLSSSYIEESCKILQGLALKNAHLEAQGFSISNETARLQNLALSSCFLLTVGFGCAFMKPLPPRAPPSKPQFLPTLALERIIDWSPYPKQFPTLQVPFNDLHGAHYTLHMIGPRILKVHFDARTPYTQLNIASIDNDLHLWKLSLSESLLINELSMINPPIMDLHLTYHWFRITLFNFVRMPNDDATPKSSTVNTSQDYAHQQTVEAAQAIARLCQFYARDHGLKRPTIWMPQTAASAAYSLINNLSGITKDGTAISSIFHELCLVLVAASRHWPVMRGHVRMLFVTAEEKEQKLPKATKDLLKFVALDNWREQDHLLFVSASYPNYALAKDEDPRLAAMGDLLAKWAHFKFEDDEKETERETMLISGEQNSPQLRSLRE